MSRLRIRIELSRGGVGVPLGKLASVVDEAQKFLRMLAEDVHIDGAPGEWMGFDFDQESLNFTAEYTGTVTAAQVRQFYAAFDGTTALRPTTIGQFAKITDAISEDELVGFGLYGSDELPEPSEWRCLSRRDALRIGEEIKLLSQASSQQESHLPAVTDAGARLFGKTRDDESTLAERLTRVERRVEQHSAQIHDLRDRSAATEDSFRNLLSAVETFCDQATQQIERATPAVLPAPQQPRSNRRWPLIALGAILGGALLFAGMRLWPARSAAREAPRVVAAAPASPPPPVEVQKRAQPMRIEMEASEPCWVSLTDADGNRLLTRALMPGDPRTVEVERMARLRTGNAGGLKVSLNGKPLGPLGPKGKIREIEFKDGNFKITSPEQ
jgi:hypothetical protein